ncbi:MAG: hypothetical protein MUF36_03435 [Bacteroidales bacterium]|jgi:hypothetical protein|nr:hypothetical protein [Bacteroidales bacterium]
MTFPFTFKFSKRINARVSPDDFEKIFNDIGDFLDYESVDKITIDREQLSFTPQMFFSVWRFNKMKFIDKGIFRLEYIDSDCYLTYEIFMYILVIAELVMFAVLGFTTKDPLTILIIAGIIIIGSWLVTVIRHRLMLNEIVSDLESSIAKRNGRKKEFV